MIKYLKLEDIFDDGKYQGISVREVIENDRKNVLTLSKQGYYFDDEVYEFANYKRSIRDVEFHYEFIDKVKQNKDKKKYTNDSVEKTRKFSRELSTLEDNSYIDEKEDSIDEIEIYTDEE